MGGADAISEDAHLIRPESLFYREQQPGALSYHQQVATSQRNVVSILSGCSEIQDSTLAADIPLKGAAARLLSRELGRPQAEGQRHDWENPGDHTHQTASVECLHQDLPGAYRCRFARYVKMRELVLGLRERGGSGGLKKRRATILAGNDLDRSRQSSQARREGGKCKEWAECHDEVR